MVKRKRRGNSVSAVTRITALSCIPERNLRYSADTGIRYLRLSLVRYTTELTGKSLLVESTYREVFISGKYSSSSLYPHVSWKAHREFSPFDYRQIEPNLMYKVTSTSFKNIIKNGKSRSMQGLKHFSQGNQILVVSEMKNCLSYPNEKIEYKKAFGISGTTYNRI